MIIRVRYRGLFAGLTLLLTALSGLSPALAYAGCAGDLAPPAEAGFEQELIELVNQTRSQHGLPPLKRTVELDQAARYYAADMSQDNYIEADHATYDRSGGSLIFQCAWSDRITTYYPSWMALAENIAAGQPTPAEALADWMASSGHRDIVLSELVWEAGAGYYTGGDYGHTWTLDLGRRANVYPVVIAGEASETISATVSLYVYGDWDEIRLRNEDGAWSDWMPFQNSLVWALSPGDGEKTVAAEMRSSASSASASDTITYLTPAASIYLPLVLGPP